MRSLRGQAEARGGVLTLTIDERLRRIEELLGIAGRPLEAWVVQPNRDENGGALDYWGPFPSRKDAQESDVFLPQFGCAIIELPVA